MKRRRPSLVLIGVAVAVALIVGVTAALAVPPTLISVSHQDRHPVATFAAPRAGFAAIYVASNPARATDGKFLTENVVTTDVLADNEIQTGRWVYERQLDPGQYWLMLDALPDFDSCYITGGGFDRVCADGQSAVLPLMIPKPTVRYAGTVTVYKFIRQATLRLTARPLGERQPYRVCYRLKTRRQRCLAGTLRGFDWDSAANDSRSVNTRSLPTLSSFTWYVNGKSVASKRVRVR